jgi:hypothetical protein
MTISAASVGRLVTVSAEDDTAQLAIVSEPDNDSDLARVIYQPCPGGNLATRAVPQGSLGTVPSEIDAVQWELAQRLAARFAYDVQERVATLCDESARLRHQADAAYQKITAVREYAITKYADGDICREGLDEFLAAHHLDPYQPRYSARVTLRVDVEVSNADDEDEAREQASTYLQASSGDDDVRITSADFPEVTDIRVVS